MPASSMNLQLSIFIWPRVFDRKDGTLYCAYSQCCINHSIVIVRMCSPGMLACINTILHNTNIFINTSLITVNSIILTLIQHSTG